MANKAYGWVGEIYWQYLPSWMPAWLRAWMASRTDNVNFGYLQTYMLMLGFRGTAAFHPTAQKIVDSVGVPEVVLYMSNAHGDSFEATVRDRGGTGDPSKLYSSDGNPNLATAMLLRQPVKFSFLMYCNSMKQTGYSTWSYVLRKNSTSGTVVVGITEGDTWPASRWITFHTHWATSFFSYVRMGLTFWEAYVKANRDMPDLEPYVVFNGDKTLTKDDLLT